MNAKGKIMHENEIAKQILDCAFKIHKDVGPGLLESVYEELLSYEIIKRGLFVQRQVGIPLNYESIKMEIGFRADIIVENKVIIELKSIETILDVHKKQLLTYLKLSGLKLGLLINFNTYMLKDGIVRIVNKLDI
jgi:GxxExxY protein